MSETWVINESPLGDTYSSPSGTTFISNGTSFIAFDVFSKSINYYSPNQVTVYSNSSWKNEAYRTIIFDEAPSGDLLVWLKSHAIKEGQLSIDLTTLSGWSSLSSGTYDVYVKSKGKDVPSDASESVSVTKSSGYDVNINSYTLTAPGASHIYLKFDTPPTEEYDCDISTGTYEIYSGGSFTNKRKAYIYVELDNSNTFVSVTSSSGAIEIYPQSDISDKTWDSPLVIDLSEMWELTTTTPTINLILPDDD